MRAEEAFNRVSPLLNKYARRYARTLQESPQDLLSELTCEFLSSYSRYDCEKSRLSTWANRLAWRKLRGMARESKVVAETRASMDDIAVNTPHFCLDDLFASLSDESREVLTALLELPRHHRVFTTRSINRICNTLGRSFEAIHKNLHEIREAVWG